MDGWSPACSSPDPFFPTLVSGAKPFFSLILLCDIQQDEAFTHLHRQKRLFLLVETMEESSAWGFSRRPNGSCRAPKGGAPPAHFITQVAIGTSGFSCHGSALLVLDPKASEWGNRDRRLTAMGQMYKTHCIWCRTYILYVHGV